MLGVEFVPNHTMDIIYIYDIFYYITYIYIYIFPFFEAAIHVQKQHQMYATLPKHNAPSSLEPPPVAAMEVTGFYIRILCQDLMSNQP